MTDPKPTPEGLDSASRNDRTLYIDCVPLAGVYWVLWEELCGPVEREFQAAAGKPWQSMQYREGTGPMYSAFQQMDLPEAIYLSSAHPLYSEARAALVPRCGVVVEGTR